MSKFIASWLVAAAEILEAEVASVVDLLPGAAIPTGAASFTLMAEIAGDWRGSFTITVDESALGALLANAEHAKSDVEEQPAADSIRERWQRIFHRISLAAAADLGARSEASCEVATISSAMVSSRETAADAAGIGYQLRAGETVVAFVLSDQVEIGVSESPRPPISAAASVASGEAPGRETAQHEVAVEAETEAAQAIDINGLELLLDVELEASLRFGSREMALSDLLALGPGDVIQLDRALADPVDLIIGDKIVARGEVVLVNGNFGLQIAEVAEPRKSLESIRCLF